MCVRECVCMSTYIISKTCHAVIVHFLPTDLFMEWHEYPSKSRVRENSHVQCIHIKGTVALCPTVHYLEDTLF